MATSKAPFPDPALEIGIPQYPTPNVPDFYTKSGHIILVEKLSAEKGSYNPQPLDGSITYNKRDANKWPSPLYLVYQRPDETGKFIYNYYANDRTLASQDPWNFGLDYSSNNPAFPIATRTYIVPRSQYATVALGSVDPVFGGAMKIASQKKEELPDGNPLRSRYVAVQRVYETIPGPVLTGKQLTERGEVETVSTQVVVAGTNPDADGLLVTQTNVQAVDAVKSLKTTGTVANYATLSNARNQAGLLGTTSISDNIVAAGTSADSVSMTVIDSTVEAISATKSRKRTTTSVGPTSLTAQRISERGDTQTITKSIVSASAEVTADDLLLVSSQVDEIDSAKSQKTDTTVESYAQLTTKSRQAGLLGETSTTDDIVAPATNPDALSTTVINSTVEAISATKSRKRTTTSSGPNSLGGVSAKAGLLGNTSVAESIVTSGSSADELSLTVIQSEVTPIDSAKSKKTTITSVGPTSLSGKTNNSGLLGNTTEQESIVASSANPDALSMPTSLVGGVLQSIITPIDGAKSKKTTITSNGPLTLGGSANKSGLLGVTTIEESIVSAGSSADALSQITNVLQSEVTPIDGVKSKKTTIKSIGPTSLGGKEFKGGLLGVTTTTESIVDYGSDPDASMGVIQSTVTPVDSVRSKKTTVLSSTPIVLDGKSMQEFGIATAKEQVVTYGTTVVPVTNTIKVDVDPIDSFKSKLTELKYDAIETLNGYQYDPDLNLIISTTKELIAEDSAPLGITTGLLAYKDEPISAWQTVRIVSRINSLPPTRYEYKSGSYSSPNLVTGFTTSVTQLPSYELNVSVTPIMRARRSYQTVFKYETSYQYNQPDPLDETLYDPITTNIYYDGYFFKINIPDALTNPDLSVTFSTPSTDPIHGLIDETYDVPVTDETASDYEDKVTSGEFQLISFEIEYWKANIWRVSKQFVLLK